MRTSPKFSATVVNPVSPTDNEGDPEGVNLNNFFSLMNKSGAYIFIPCRDIWPRASVNARLPPMPVLNKNGNPRRGSNGKIIYQPASKWLDKNRPVEMMTWAPGLPLRIPDRLISLGGWIERKGVSCCNLYRPPRIKLGDASKAKFWLDHVYRIYPDDADHIIKWLAHRVQRPQDKINHALVLGGAQGIGKDSLLEPVKHAIGEWNFSEVSPQQMLGRFNGFVKSVILRINEARNLGEFDRYSFYEHTKAYICTPPNVLRVDEKNLREHHVVNVMLVIITTNHKANGIYLPADDRRHYVAWSALRKEDFTEEYWKTLWTWYENGGYEAVAHYLQHYNLSDFNAKAPPPKTPAFWEIVDASRAPEDAELADVLDCLGNPDVVMLQRIQTQAQGDFLVWLTD